MVLSGTDKHLRLQRLLIVCAVALLFAVLAQLVLAQTPTGCPHATTRSAWARNSKVYVTLDSSFTADQRAQIQAALLRWNTANANDNRSNVEFIVGAPPNAGDNVLTIQQGTVYRDPNNANNYSPTATTWPVANDIGALTQRNGTDGAGQLNNATITFNTNGAQANPGCPTCGQFYDPALAGYGQVFLKILLHEIGHTLGMGEAPGTPGGTQTPQNSVMNQITGGCPNDACTVNGTPGGNLPLQIQPCDNQAVNEHLNYEDIACNGCDPCLGDPCCGDSCCGDPYCGDPCQGDPYCGDPCGGDPYCGDPCQGDPCCGNGTQTVCTQFCWYEEVCTAYDDCGNCYWYDDVRYCDPPDCHEECR
jgi:hypothetical protein